MDRERHEPPLPPRGPLLPPLPGQAPPTLPAPQPPPPTGPPPVRTTTPIAVAAVLAVIAGFASLLSFSALTSGDAQRKLYAKIQRIDAEGIDVQVTAVRVEVLRNGKGSDFAERVEVTFPTASGPVTTDLFWQDESDYYREGWQPPAAGSDYALPFTVRYLADDPAQVMAVKDLADDWNHDPRPGDLVMAAAAAVVAVLLFLASFLLARWWWRLPSPRST